MSMLQEKNLKIVWRILCTHEALAIEVVNSVFSIARVFELDKTKA